MSADLASQAYSSRNGEAQWPILRIVSNNLRCLLPVLTSISNVAQARSVTPALETDELPSRLWLLQMTTYLLSGYVQVADGTGCRGTDRGHFE
jgi:hypothetical protein